jgi:hypothetical protein
MTMESEAAETCREAHMDEAKIRDLRNVIATLVEQRGIIDAAGAAFATRLMDITIMQLRMTVNDISEEELSGFSDFLGVGRAGDERPN